MFIVKLVFNNTIKKIKFLDEYKDPNLFKSVIREITNFGNFKMSFIDEENEEIFLEDAHDLEYFMAQSDEKCKKIVIKEIFNSQEDSFELEIEEGLEKPKGE